MIEEEKTAIEAAAREENKLYKPRSSTAYPEVAEAVKAQKISDAVGLHKELLSRFDHKARLEDTEAVKAVANDYLATCQASAQIPTLMGLSAALGYSRTAVYRFMAKNPYHDTTEYIDAFRSASASIIAQGSLSRTLDNATSIFLLKNSGQGLNDRQELEISRGLDAEPKRRIDPREIEEKYGYDPMPV